MQVNGNISNEKIHEAMKLAQSDAGRELYALLQRTQGKQLQSAMDQASAGDYAQVQKTLSSLLSNPEAKKLLEKMGKP